MALPGPLAGARPIAGDAVACGEEIPEASLSFTRLEQVSRQCGAGSLDSILPYLPKSMRQRFTLVYESRAFFGGSASWDYPRAVLYGDSGRVVFTFVGNPDKPGYGKIEGLEFDPASRSFSLQFGEFLPEGAGPPVLAFKRNDSRCLGCHTGQGKGLHAVHPVFDSYELWPGMYGSHDDVIYPDRTEGMQFKAFMEGNFLKGLYRHLGRDDASWASPYSPPGVRENSIAHTPNGTLTLQLSALNAARIAEIIRASDRYEREEPRILYWLAGCPLKAEEREATRRIELLVRSQRRDQIERHGVEGAHYRGLGSLPEKGEVTGRLKLVADRLGLDPDDWSMGLDSGSWLYSHGLLPPTTVVLSRLLDRATAERRHPELLPLSPVLKHPLFELLGFSLGYDYHELTPVAPLVPVPATCRALDQLARSRGR
jgi:hypothetical protein